MTQYILVVYMCFNTVFEPSNCRPTGEVIEGWKSYGNCLTAATMMRAEHSFNGEHELREKMRYHCHMDMRK